MSTAFSTEEFVAKVKTKGQNHKYDYSKTLYKNLLTNVEVICPEHGSFIKSPLYLLQGLGCNQCRRVNKGLSAKPKSNVYWTDEQNEAVIKYIESSDPKERNLIYEEHLHESLRRMVEAIANRFKFEYALHYLHDQTDLLIEYVLAKMTSVFVHLDAKKKSNFYSYLGTVIKNELINLNNSKYKEGQAHFSLDFITKTCEDEGTKLPKELIEEDRFDNDSNNSKEFLRQCVDYYKKNRSDLIKKRVGGNKNKQYAIILDAIIDIFSNPDQLENFNKKSIYKLLRKKTGLETPKLTTYFRIILTPLHEKLYKSYLNGEDL